MRDISSGRIIASFYEENDDANVYDELYSVFDYSYVIGNIHEHSDVV